jgi:hypothetical protein
VIEIGCHKATAGHARGGFFLRRITRGRTISRAHNLTELNKVDTASVDK